MQSRAAWRFSSAEHQIGPAVFPKTGRRGFEYQERVDVFTAMQGVTISAARTLQLENALGSIKVD